MSPRIGVVTFPGSLDDRDVARALRLVGATPVRLWHSYLALHEVDAVILPGGSSYGDHLRPGALARFAPIMAAVAEAAAAGMPILGIGNGFQVLCEAMVLPGALVRNADLRFCARDQALRVTSTSTPWTSGYQSDQQIVMPVKSRDARYVAEPAVLDELEANGRVVARYVDGCPSGSQRAIAAICSEAGNVVGMMPHPEHAIDALTGPSTDGLSCFASVVDQLGARA